MSGNRSIRIGHCCGSREPEVTMVGNVPVAIGQSAKYSGSNGICPPSWYNEPKMAGRDAIAKGYNSLCPHSWYYSRNEPRTAGCGVVAIGYPVTEEYKWSGTQRSQGCSAIAIGHCCERTEYNRYNKLCCYLEHKDRNITGFYLPDRFHAMENGELNNFRKLESASISDDLDDISKFAFRSNSQLKTLYRRRSCDTYGSKGNSKGIFVFLVSFWELLTVFRHHVQLFSFLIN